MGKINVAELLKDCPKGMELDCINYDGVVTFEEISNCSDYPIKITVKYNNECVTHTLTKYGQTCISPYNKCIIFPKGKTTWEGFNRPFKDGDIIATDLGSVFILKSCLEDKIHYHSYFGVTCCNEIQEKQIPFAYKDVCHLATEEEKQKLFQAIKDSDYRWNTKTKTLEKLIKPIFKVGDRIRRKNDTTTTKIIGYIYHDSYALYNGHLLLFKEQDLYELVPDKFDISKLKPFDEVLVRDFDSEVWEIDFFSKLLDGKHFKCHGSSYVQCIPYKGNEHLHNTTNACHHFYKTWEK